MPTVYIDGTAHRLSPTAAIGKGGEADVFRLDGQTALKLFKAPDHPDFAGQPVAANAARDRLAIHQTKLPVFPAGLPARVITPRQLVQDKTGRIIGYTMPLISGTEPLKRYGERSFREGRVSEADVLELFQDLHTTVAGLHSKQVVIGDFNDLNILVSGAEGYFIDADSMQFQNFPCLMFSPRFVDPLLCADKGSGLELIRPHSSDSDWYAFAVLLMQSLLYVDPYGGVYRPKHPGDRLPHPKRPLRRITVFHPEVQYPKPAIPYSVLPAELLDYFRAVFEHDQRMVFPSDLLDYSLWTGTVKPVAAPLAVSNEVKMTVVFETSGHIVDTGVYGSRLVWLYHQDNELRRETGAIVLPGPYDPQLRGRLHGLRTLLAKNGKLAVLDQDKVVESQSVSQFGPQPLATANQHHYYWLDRGQLQRSDRFGAKVIGQVLDAQTMFWVGEQFGLGLTRAGKLQYTFLFDARSSGINDSLVFQPVNGQLFDATCCFSTEQAWLLLAYQEAGQEYRRVVVYDRSGKLMADERFAASDDHWTRSIRGNAAVGPFLLASTDDGIVRIEVQAGKLALTRQFTETAAIVSRDTKLLAAPDGLYAVDQHRILHLSLN